MSDPTEPGVTSSSNNSSILKHSSCFLQHSSALPVFILIYSLLFLVGLVLNSFTMWFHCCAARQQVSSSWMIYLKNLTASDLLLCLSLPFRITKYASCSFSIHLLYCSFGASSLYLNMYASILFMGYIAADRFIKIFYPLRTHFLMTPRAAHIISKTTWAVLLVPVTLYIILMLVTHKPLGSAPTSCVLFVEQVKPFYYFFQTTALIIFLPVLFSLVFFYYSASRRVLEAQQTQLTSSSSMKLVKSRRNILVLVIVFCVCFVPYHLVHVPYVLLRSHQFVVLDYLKEASVLMSVLNICLDPLIYVFLSKRFRTQMNLKEMFTTTKQNRRSSQQSDRVSQQSTNTS